jgi:hypothetical protein
MDTWLQNVAHDYESVRAFSPFSDLIAPIPLCHNEDHSFVVQLGARHASA